MKKNTALLAVSAATSLMGLLPPDLAHATACTTQGTASTPVYCTITTGAASYVAQQVDFTGSNGVLMTYENAAAGFGACAAHVGGSQAYGLSTAGGSMMVKTGAAGADINTAQTATSGAGC